jgi:DNA-binding transcriptional ArsR family regulator
MTDDTMELSSAEHFKALGHPTRQRLLFELDEPATISQLAASLDTHKGNVAHHLKVLTDAGLVVLSSTRQVRGGTERYHQRTARMMSVVGEASQANVSVSFQAIAAEVAAAAPDPFLALRHIRLSPAQVEAITAALNELAHHTEPAGSDQPRYGLLLGLYRQPDAPSSPR